MTGPEHRGTTMEFEIAKLPEGWKFTDGLHFPLVLKKADGLELTFYGYKEYHEYIAQLFKN